MATRSFDFSQLSAAERIKLAEELWDSVGPADVPLSAAQATELDWRREVLRREGSRGRSWREALEDLRKRGGRRSSPTFRTWSFLWFYQMWSRVLPCSTPVGIPKSGAGGLTCSALMSNNACSRQPQMCARFARLIGGGRS